MTQGVDLNDRIAVEIAIIQNAILLYSKHHGSHQEIALIFLSAEKSKLIIMKQEHPEYFL